MAKMAKHLRKSDTPVSEKISDDQVKNAAGGYVFKVSDRTRLDRFLILGSVGGTYYATERKLTLDNVNDIEKMIGNDGVAVVNRVVEVSDQGLAPTNDPALLVLALCATKGDQNTRRAAFEALPKVARIGSHLYVFEEYMKALEGGWGRAHRRAVADWYNDKPVDKVAYQAIKYRQREGWSHRDLLRLAHPRPSSPDHGVLYRWITQGIEGVDKGVELPALIQAYEEAKTATPKRLVQLIKDYNLPREAVPTDALQDKDVWDALLHAGPHGMPMMAMIRNLGKMSQIGLLTPNSNAASFVISKLSDTDTLRNARVHPIKLLAAQMTYAAGRGARGSLSWNPIAPVVDALEDAFYESFKHVEPTGKRYYLALDVSGSMGWGDIAGIPGMTPRVASAALAMVTARTEKQYHIAGFTTRMQPINVTARDKLNTVVSKISNLPFGGTDASIPPQDALKSKIPVDVFAVYTDNETWAGRHPTQTLKAYRKGMGIQSKLVVIGMTATECSIADPKDPLQLDVVGFSADTPQAINAFVNMDAKA